MPEESPLTAEELRALNELLPADQRTGDTDADLIAAAWESLRRRDQNSLDGGAVFDAMNRRGRSWREIGTMFGIPWSSARDWRERFRRAVSTETPEAPTGR